MSKGKRDTYTSEFKFKVAIEAMSGDKTLAQLASEYHVHPSQITKWKEQLKGSASAVFGSPSRRKKRETMKELGPLHLAEVSGLLCPPGAKS